jgi:hypothetical protein
MTKYLRWDELIALPVGSRLYLTWKTGITEDEKKVVPKFLQDIISEEDIHIRTRVIVRHTYGHVFINYEEEPIHKRASIIDNDLRYVLVCYNTEQSSEGLQSLCKKIKDKYRKNNE